MLRSVLDFLGIALTRKPLEVGAAAPDVTVPDENGTPVRLGDVYARGLTLIYFYPMASTPGCTMQACSLRDAMAELDGLGVTVLGVSHNSPTAQKRFKEKQHLPFTLLADEEGKVISAFGVPTIAFGVSLRQSFLVQEGRIVWRSLSAQTRSHAEEVRQAIAALHSTTCA
jgi:peroxiredoxin Q/BCP